MNRVGMPVRRRRAAPCYIFEGLWWQTREVPQVLPFLQALAAFDGGLSLSHRTFRTGDDLRYWFSRIPKGDRSLVYIACHGRDGNLEPVDGRSKVGWEELIGALRAAKPGAIEFLHFGACEIVEEGNRRHSLEALAKASGARWVSGYTKSMDWLSSMLLDVAVVADLYLPFYHDTYSRRPQLQKRAQWFLQTYEQIARDLGFSGLARRLTGINGLVPERLRT